MGIRISEMEEATTFGADDYVPIVTNGTNKKALGSKIKDFIAGFFATKTGDNISDKATFRSAIEISATNTPFDKTGTGMSAENVQAAIAELSGNRALIDGSNIANPSAFRQSIDIYTGQVVSDDDSTSVKTGSSYQVGLSINLPAGSWYVLGSCRAELKSANGRIMSNIGRNTTFTTADYFTQSCYSVKDLKLRVQTSAIVRPSETTTYSYVLYSDDSTAIYDLFHIIAIRIS